MSRPALVTTQPLPFNRNCSSPSRDNAAGIWSWPLPSTLVPQLRVRGGTPPSVPYAFMPCIFTQQQEAGRANITTTGGYENDTFRTNGYNGPSDCLSLRNISACFCSIGMWGCQDLCGDKSSSLFTQFGCCSKSILSLMITVHGLSPVPIHPSVSSSWLWLVGRPAVKHLFTNYMDSIVVSKNTCKNKTVISARQWTRNIHYSTTAARYACRVVKILHLQGASSPLCLLETKDIIVVKQLYYQVYINLGINRLGTYTTLS